MSYNYNEIISKIIISGTNFNGSKTPADISSTSLISCNDIKKFTIDSFLYLHIYTGLYISLLEYLNTNNNDIEKFDNLIKNLKIKIDTQTSTPLSLYTFNNEDMTFVIYLHNFKTTFNSETNAGYINTNANTNKHRPVLLNLNTLIGSSIIITPETDETEILQMGEITFNKTNINSTVIANTNSRINKLKVLIYEILNTKTENMQSYLKYFSCYYQLILYNTSIQVSLRTFYLNAITTTSPYQINTKIGSGANVDNTNIKTAYKISINTTITEGKGGAGFEVGDIIELNNTHTTYKAKCVVRAVSSFSAITEITPLEEGYYGSGTPEITYTCKKRDGTLRVPISIPEFNLTIGTSPVIYIGMSNYGSGYYYDPDISLTNINVSTPTYIYKKDDGEKYSTYGIKAIIVEGTDISINANPSVIITSKTTRIIVETKNNVSDITNSMAQMIVQGINTNIYDMIANINNLNINTIDNDVYKIDEYTIKKSEYVDKIRNLNATKLEHQQYQNEINYKIRLYNEHVNNLKRVKKYANYIIYILVFIIAITLILSLLPFITSNIKFTYYVILIIILSILIALYYNNFKDVHLNEKFTDYYSDIIDTSGSNPNTCKTGVIVYNDRTDRDKHAFIINQIGITLNNYYNIYYNFINQLKFNITSIGTDVFTRDMDNNLNGTYLTKKKEIDLFKVRKVELTNSIEIIKKHIIYLFNLILFISLFTIILILGLLLYTIIPTMITSIIVLCVILLIFIIGYFTFKLLYPTRLIASKNYWAPHNPSSKITSKLT